MLPDSSSTSLPVTREWTASPIIAELPVIDSAMPLTTAIQKLPISAAMISVRELFSAMGAQPASSGFVARRERDQDWFGFIAKASASRIAMPE